MLKTSLSTLILLAVFHICYSQDSTYIKHVSECYKQEKFKDLLVRFELESTCFEGLKIPTFSAITLDKRDIHSDDFEGKVVVLKFWTNYCAPCISEIPSLNKLVEDFNENEVLFLAPSMDDSETITNLIRQYGQFDFQIIPNSDHLLRNILLSNSGFPLTIIIDKKGIIRYYNMGGEKNIEDTYSILKSKIESYL